MMISGEEQNPLKCLSSLDEIWNFITIIFYRFITDFVSHNNRCDRTGESYTPESLAHDYHS